MKKLFVILCSTLMISGFNSLDLIAKEDEQGNYFPNEFDSYEQYRQDPNYYKPERVKEREQAYENLDNYIRNKSRQRTGARKQLDVKTIRQTKSWYCGPATIQMVIKYKKGSAPSQDKLATMLNTTSSQGTGIEDMIRVLKKEVTKYYNLSNDREKSFYDALIYNVDKNYPIILNIKTYKMHGYGTKDLYHYIVGQGYSYSFWGSTGHNDVVYNDPYESVYGNEKSFGKQTTDKTKMQNALRRNAGYYFW